MEENRQRRRIVQVLCGAVLFVLLVGALLASPVDGLAGATPRSRVKGDTKLSGSYMLLLNSRQFPFDEDGACQAFGRFFSQRQADLAPLAGQTVVLYIPGDDAALAAYSQALVQRAASRQVTLTVRLLEQVFLRSRLRARRYEAILVPAASLPDGLDDQACVYEYKSYVLR